MKCSSDTIQLHARSFIQKINTQVSGTHSLIIIFSWNFLHFQAQFRIKIRAVVMKSYKHVSIISILPAHLSSEQQKEILHKVLYL